MKTIGAGEAKTQFPALLERVRMGEEFTITRHGIPIALLSPAVRNTDARSAIARLREVRSGNKLHGDSLRGLIEEGRRR